MKKYCYVLAGLLAMLCAISAVRGFFSPEQVIRRYLRRNGDEMALVMQQQVDGTDPEGALGAIGGWRVERYLRQGAQPIVQVDVTSTGIAPAGKYYGFYYAPQDQPAAFQNGGETLAYRPEEAAWYWQGQGDNGGLTKKLAAHWYYYEAWF